MLSSHSLHSLTVSWEEKVSYHHHHHCSAEHQSRVFVLFLDFFADEVKIDLTEIKTGDDSICNQKLLKLVTIFEDFDKLWAEVRIQQYQPNSKAIIIIILSVSFYIWYPHVYSINFWCLCLFPPKMPTCEYVFFHLRLDSINKPLSVSSNFSISLKQKRQNGFSSCDGCQMLALHRKDH